MVTPDEWNALRTRGGAMDLSAAVKLRLSGPDAQRYLNGQVSNDVRRIPDGGSLPACVCTHKGKLEALIMIARHGDAFLITADAALRDFLPLRMEKYLIADDAVLEDVTDVFDLVHVFGPHEVPAGLAITAARTGEPGRDVWLPRGTAAGLAFTRPEAVELLRIARGIPSWDNELSRDILPPEARLEETAIDYHKGCYTGQEVISRLRSVGRVNRLILPVISTTGQPLEPGWTLTTDDGASAGEITSAAWHPAWQTGIGLAFIKRAAMDSPLLAGPASTPLSVRKTLDDPKP